MGRRIQRAPRIAPHTLRYRPDGATQYHVGKRLNENKMSTHEAQANHGYMP